MSSHNLPASTSTPPAMTPEEFKALGYRMIDWIAHYIADPAATVGDRPIRSAATPGDLLRALPDSPPIDPEPASTIEHDLHSLILPGVTHWQHPAFMGYFSANNSYPSILGELLSAGLGVQGMLWETSPAATELEVRVLDWLAQLLGLPDPFQSGLVGDRTSPMNDAPGGGGVLQATASEATLVAIVAAADDLARRTGATRESMRIYTSEQAHSSVIKAVGIAGMGRPAARLIPTDDQFAMDPEALRVAIEEDLAAGLHPCAVVATMGTTSTGAFDPIDRIGALTKAHNLWLHVDAAWAGSAMVCPELRAPMVGVELADSFCTNPHKWLLTNFDCSAFFVNGAVRRQQLTSALSITPAYLRNAGTDRGAIDYRDWQIPLGRRFRALKLWFVLRSFGATGLRSHIQGHVRIAEALERAIRADDRFEVFPQRSLALVCLRARGGDALTSAIIQAVNDTGKALLTQTIVEHQGAPTTLIRIAIGAPTTTLSDAQAVWSLITSAHDRLAP